jgi:hypothetical protein
MNARAKEEILPKKRTMTKAEARAWLARWRRVNEIERDELRNTPMEAKLRQLAALMASVNQLGWREDLAAEETQARDRWKQLRRAYGY